MSATPAAAAGGSPPNQPKLDEAIVKRSATTHRVTFTISDLDLLETLGIGLFSRVRLVRHKTLQTFFALKIMKKGEILRRDQMQHVKDEVSLLQRMTGPWFPTMYGVFQDELRVYVLMNVIQGGELYFQLRIAERFSEERALFYTCQLVVILEVLQGMHIVHRDIKPENLMLSTKGSLVLVDFSLAKVVPERTWTTCGTPEYIAPEVLTGNGYGKSVDWWALGVVTYEMLAGVLPFCDETAFGIYKKVEEARPAFPPKLFANAAAKDFVSALLTKDRTQRLGATKGSAEVMEHRWFKKVDWDAVRHQQIPPPFRPSVQGPDDLTHFDRYPDSQLDPSRPLSTHDRRAFTDLMQGFDDEWVTQQLAREGTQGAAGKAGA